MIARLLALRCGIYRSARKQLVSQRFASCFVIPNVVKATHPWLRCMSSTCEGSPDNEESASTATKKSNDSKWMKKPETQGEAAAEKPNKASTTDGKFYFDADVENLSPEQQKQKEEIIKELTKRLSGPLADENGNVPTGDDRPIAIEVDGPSHFYANSTKYTAYTKLKHRLLTRMGYKVLHVPYFEWRRLRGAKEREDYMREKLKEEPTEWIDPEDEAFYNKRMEALKRQTDGVVNALEQGKVTKSSK